MTDQTEHGYCPNCGRGDCAPTADQYEQQRQKATRAEAALREVLDAFEAYWARAIYCGPDMSAVQPEHFQAWRATLTPATAATEATDEDYCGAEPPPNGNWGDCWCTLPPGHPDGHRCQPCTERHSAPDWTDPPTPCPACRRADQAGLAADEQHPGCVTTGQP